MACVSCSCVTKRRNSWAYRGNPNPEQETINGTHTQETPAYQRRLTTQYAAQGSNPPIGALHMQLAKIPHTHQTTPPATRAASADQHGALRTAIIAASALASCAAMTTALFTVSTPIVLIVVVRVCLGGDIVLYFDAGAGAAPLGCALSLIHI